MKNLAGGWRQARLSREGKGCVSGSLQDVLQRVLPRKYRILNANIYE